MRLLIAAIVAVSMIGVVTDASAVARHPGHGWLCAHSTYC